MADRIEEVRQFVRDQSVQPTALPPAGTGPSARQGQSKVALVVAAAVGVALGFGALLLGRKRGG